LRIMYIM